MDALRAKALLNSLSLSERGISSEVGMRNAVAYLKLWRDSDPDNFAVVNTPGANWYELAVRGGFAATHFDEEATDAEVTEILEKYVKVAIAYLRGESTIVTSRIFKVPSVVVATDQGRVSLNLSLAGAAKAIFGSQA